MRKERTTAGPAWSRATCPVMTYTPAPNVLPTPVQEVLVIFAEKRNVGAYECSTLMFSGGGGVSFLSDPEKGLQ